MKGSKRYIITIILFCLSVAIITILLTYSNNGQLSKEIKNISPEKHIQYIIEKYNFTEDKNYINDYVVTTSNTNEYLIDKLSMYDSVKSIKLIKDSSYRVEVDDTVLEIYINIDNGKITKLRVKEAV